MTDVTAKSIELAEFTCTEANLLVAQRLHQALAIRGLRFLTLAFMVGIVIAVVLTTAMRSTGIKGFESFLEILVVYFGIIAILILITYFIYLPRIARRHLSQMKELEGPVKVGVSSPNIERTTKNGYSKMPTADFLKWTENGKTVLLYRTDRLFNVVPKRAMSEAFHRSLVAELTRAEVSKVGFTNI